MENYVECWNCRNWSFNNNNNNTHEKKTEEITRTHINDERCEIRKIGARLTNEWMQFFFSFLKNKKRFEWWQHEICNEYTMDSRE